jgi:hypothetical protein
MKIKRIKDLKVNSYHFSVVWDKDLSGGSVSYSDLKIVIGLRNAAQGEIFETICHELMEVCAMEMHVKYTEPDCVASFLFVYDHKQHDTMINMFSSLLSQFIGD